MTVTVRFAPSPTGRLHVGNARIALINWLFAKSQGGSFVLRIDDTDRERSRADYEDAIRADLRWLGLLWDREASQSRRQDRYDVAAETLRAAGRLYACYETPEELDYKRKRQLSRGAPPVYDRAGLSLTEAQRQALEGEGRRPHWRFKLLAEDVTWNDLVRGPCHYRAEHLSDPVLIRADGTVLYTLPSVVDDIELEISHVIRGEDHVTNTAAQIQLFRALGAEPPVFGHLSLLTDASGAGLSKRLGSLSLGDLRAEGLDPLALDSLLARLGTSEPVLPRHSLEALTAEFAIGKFSRATPKFDPAELLHLNARLLHDLPYAAALPRLQAQGIAAEATDADDALWTAIRANLGTLAEAADWWRVCRDRLAPPIEDPGFLAQAAALLPAEPWDGDTWKAWTEAVKQASGRKGRPLFHPLRLALTGHENGPEMKSLLPLIGRSRTFARLHGETA